MRQVDTLTARGWNWVGTRLLPFSDAPIPGLPLTRLLRLSLFQLAAGMAAVLVISTLDRVMIVELGVPASLVGAMIALPLLLAPLRALIGHRSDTHRSALGWRRLPFLWLGTMLQFGGFAIMPFALIVLSGDAGGPRFAGPLAAAVAFLLVGLGMHTVQTVGLALATDLAPAAACPRVVALLCAAMLVSIAASAPVFGLLLRPFSEIRLIQVLQGASVATLALNGLALWKQEARRPASQSLPRAAPSLRRAWGTLDPKLRTVRVVLAIGLGTAGFSMQDVLLEPYGGQVLKLPVGTTTTLTGLLALGGLLGFLFAGLRLARGTDRGRLAAAGLLAGALSLLAVLAAALLAGAPSAALGAFALGTLGLGLGAALFETAMLTRVMEVSAPAQAGLSLGLWGAVQASAAGLAILSSGLLRDGVARIASITTGYGTVYGLEIALLVAACLALVRPVGARTPALQPR